MYICLTAMSGDVTQSPVSDSCLWPSCLVVCDGPGRGRGEGEGYFAFTEEGDISYLSRAS